ncbi:hypothetical protein BAUCODRAFT_127635 [Baudoinia panamericana UAMH 10762]|uniref:Uncharacterized protein n=1 Tax=Baudoinia panamericana (strain UAMH 10762) TaxID=717646 RepID=M2NLT8_BAUPA|nr:uncharacterized protein BAUCODRAFT_127635 [Baudoinia panamericana UAMH 10762]EMD00460.1 hypothetical protein BAUCODRAFT_127635 [Baudoinia panamericana UAMH 10762]
MPFDFGRGEALPPARGAKCESPFRSFARDAGAGLLGYLIQRRVAPSFLHEIDHFLRAHPEIAAYNPAFARLINQVPVLAGYRFFMKGYTKPARYCDQALPNISNLPRDMPQSQCAVRFDSEMRDFFEGHQYRTDILAMIDNHVNALIAAHSQGQHLTFDQRKLMVYACFGNVADAYRFYEYNYQTEWLEHRYLPEHVVLSEIPKEHGRLMPYPHQMSGPDEHCPENRRSFPATRARMARANDEGVDVLEVLLKDFTAQLCRNGLNRTEIERMRVEAVRNINHQREMGGGRGLVNMVMNRATMTQPATFGRQQRKKVRTRLSQIETLKKSLRRLNDQEASLTRDLQRAGRLAAVVAKRQRVESELVVEVTSLAMSAGEMVPKEAGHWVRLFGKKQQEKRERAGWRLDVFYELARFM